MPPSTHLAAVGLGAARPGGARVVLTTGKGVACGYVVHQLLPLLFFSDARQSARGGVLSCSLPSPLGFFLPDCSRIVSYRSWLTPTLGLGRDAGSHLKHLCPFHIRGLFRRIRTGVSVVHFWKLIWGGAGDAPPQCNARSSRPVSPPCSETRVTVIVRF